MVHLAWKHLRNIPDSGWEAAAASVKGGSQGGKTRMGSGSGRPDPLPITAPAPISGTLPPRQGRPS